MINHIVTVGLGFIAPRCSAQKKAARISLDKRTPGIYQSCCLWKDVQLKAALKCVAKKLDVWMEISVRRNLYVNSLKEG